MDARQLQVMAMKLGADVFGVSGIGRFSNAPEGFKPTDVFPDCKSVVVIGTALPKGLYRVDSRFIYAHYNEKNTVYLDRMIFELARCMEKTAGMIAVPLPSDGPYEYWEKDTLTGKGLVSMKHAAVNAGIGTLGKNTILLNGEYGNRLAVGAILVNVELEESPLAKSLCIEGCSKCLDSCPVNAIRDGSVNQSLCRQNSYGKTERGFDTVECNICRVVCPMALGKST